MSHGSGISGTPESMREWIDEAPVVPWQMTAGAEQLSYVGPHIQQILGHSVTAWSATDFWTDRVHADDREAFLRARAETGPGYRELEYRLVHEDGRTIWVRDTIRVVSPETGPRTLHGFLVDITDRRGAEIAAEWHEELCRALARTTADVLFVFDIATQEIHWIGDIEAKIGLPAERIGLWSEWEVRLHPDDRGRVLESARTAMDTMEPGRFDYRIRHADGTYRWWDVRAVPMVEKPGNARRMCGAITDVTVRKEQEIALAEHHELLSTIVEGTTDVIYVKDLEGKYVLVNGRGASIMGREVDDIVGIRDVDLFPSHKAKVFRRQDDEVIASGQPQTFDFATQILDRMREYLTVKIPWRGRDGGILGTVGIARDVTDRRRAERAVMTISTRERHRIGRDIHDGLGQRLTGIALLSRSVGQQLVEEGLPFADEAVEIERLANEAIETAGRIARGLYPATLMAGGIEVALNELASNAEETFAISCHAYVQLDAQLPDAVASQLYYVAQEAVTNAIKHGAATDIAIALESAGPAASLTVADDGEGIDRDKPAEGGLGLLIMRYRAGIIGGTLDVRLRPEGGTIVHCSFPTPCADQQYPEIWLPDPESPNAPHR